MNPENVQSSPDSNSDIKGFTSAPGNGSCNSRTALYLAFCGFLTAIPFIVYYTMVLADHSVEPPLLGGAVLARSKTGILGDPSFLYYDGTGKLEVRFESAPSGNQSVTVLMMGIDPNSCTSVTELDEVGMGLTKDIEQAPGSLVTVQPLLPDSIKLKSMFTQIVKVGPILGSNEYREADVFGISLKRNEFNRIACSVLRGPGATSMAGRNMMFAVPDVNSRKIALNFIAFTPDSVRG
jgi:hypothetical protein